MSRRLKEILERVAELEKESPYNFCDRWCERCVFEKKVRCRVYHDELEQKMICIAHGKNEDDPEIVRAVMERQYEEVGDKLEALSEENEIDLDAIDDPEFDRIKEHIKFVEHHPLPVTAEEYRRRAHAFLEDAFYPHQEGMSHELVHHFETIVWYHTLLLVKLERGLAGFHEPTCEGDLALYDAVGQFEVCRKAIRESVSALGKILLKLPGRPVQISELLALLHHLDDQIQALEVSV